MKDAAEKSSSLPIVAAVVLLLGGFGAFLFWPHDAGDVPEPVVWDRTACAHCRMHVGQPAFAAQIKTRAGEVLNFDDPGCLCMYVLREKPDIAAMWFHHSRDDRWLTRAQVAFTAGGETPMAFGYAAVDAGTPGALSYDDVLARIGREAAPEQPR